MPALASALHAPEVLPRLLVIVGTFAGVLPHSISQCLVNKAHQSILLPIFGQAGEVPQDCWGHALGDASSLSLSDERKERTRGFEGAVLD